MPFANVTTASFTVANDSHCDAPRPDLCEFVFDEVTGVSNTFEVTDTPIVIRLMYSVGTAHQINVEMVHGRCGGGDTFADLIVAGTPVALLSGQRTMLVIPISGVYRLKIISGSRLATEVLVTRKPTAIAQEFWNRPL